MIGSWETDVVFMQSMTLHVVLSLFIAEDMDLLYLAANNGKRVLAVRKYKFIFFHTMRGLEICNPRLVHWLNTLIGTPGSIWHSLAFCL